MDACILASGYHALVIVHSTKVKQHPTSLCMHAQTVGLLERILTKAKARKRHYVMQKGSMRWRPLAPRYSAVLAHRRNAKCISVVGQLGKTSIPLGRKPVRVLFPQYGGFNSHAQGQFDGIAIRTVAFAQCRVELLAMHGFLKEVELFRKELEA